MVKKIDARIKSLQLPSNIKRNPRSITERHNWKANEWRSFLLYFCVGLLYEILPFKILKHFAKFVTAIWLLIQKKIELKDIETADSLITAFSKDYENIYGKKHMTYNLHQLKHLPECVLNLGPLWAYSNFPFENNNGKLANYVKSPKGVLQQISNKYAWDRYLNTATFSIDVQKFKKKIASSSKSAPLYPDRALGKGVKFKLVDRKIINYGDLESLYFISFKRVVYNREKYCTKYYSINKKFNDSAVKLKNDSYGEIIYILDQNGGLFLVVDIFKIDVTHTLSKICPHLHIIKEISSRVIVPLSSIDFKCVLIDLDNLKYITPLIECSDND